MTNYTKKAWLLVVFQVLEKNGVLDDFYEQIEAFEANRLLCHGLRIMYDRIRYLISNSFQQWHMKTSYSSKNVNS